MDTTCTAVTKPLPLQRLRRHYRQKAINNLNKKGSKFAPFFYILKILYLPI
jgi:hypothetical protein